MRRLLKAGGLSTMGTVRSTSGRLGWRVLVRGGFLGLVGGVADGEVAVGFGDGGGVAKGHASCAVEDATDGPGWFFERVFAGEKGFGLGEEDFAGALFFGAVVPAAEEGEMVAEGGEVWLRGSGGG